MLISYYNESKKPRAEAKKKAKRGANETFWIDQRAAYVTALVMGEMKKKGEHINERKKSELMKIHRAQLAKEFDGFRTKHEEVKKELDHEKIAFKRERLKELIRRAYVDQKHLASEDDRKFLDMHVHLLAAKSAKNRMLVEFKARVKSGAIRFIEAFRPDGVFGVVTKVEVADGIYEGDPSAD
jgi:hypothetical protein